MIKDDQPMLLIYLRMYAISYSYSFLLALEIRTLSMNSSLLLICLFLESSIEFSASCFFFS